MSCLGVKGSVGVGLGGGAAPHPQQGSFRGLLQGEGERRRPSPLPRDPVCVLTDPWRKSL